MTYVGMIPYVPIDALDVHGVPDAHDDDLCGCCLGDVYPYLLDGLDEMKIDYFPYYVLYFLEILFEAAEPVSVFAPLGISAMLAGEADGRCDLHRRPFPPRYCYSFVVCCCCTDWLIFGPLALAFCMK